MENNDLKNNEKIVEQETIVDEPWTHQFESGEQKAQTRSIRNHKTDKKANLYTKIIFSAIFLAILVVATWAVLRGANVLTGSSNQNATTPPVPRLVLQSQTTAKASVSDESSTAVSNANSLESSSSNSTETTTLQTTSATVTNEQTYVIKSGDSAYSIATKYGITISQFYALNGLNANSVLLPGQTVVVSSGSSNTSTINNSTSNTQSNSSVGTYTIKSGDSLSTIAAKHGMTLSELKQLNGFTDDSLLLPGNTVKVRVN